MWHDLGTALCLVLIIEGIVPFLYPNRWKEMATRMADVSASAMRIGGFISMLVGTLLLVLSLIHISEPTRLLSIWYAVFCV